MEQLQQLLIQLGINLASSAMYELVTMYHRSTANPTEEGLKNYLASKLIIENAIVKASTIVDFMAKNGDIIVQGTNIYAPQAVNMASSCGTQLVFGNNSISATDKTKIEVGHGAHMIATGGAGTRQEGGSISFYT